MGSSHAQALTKAPFDTITQRIARCRHKYLAQVFNLSRGEIRELSSVPRIFFSALLEGHTWWYPGVVPRTEVLWYTKPTWAISQPSAKDYYTWKQWYWGKSRRPFCCYCYFWESSNLWKCSVWAFSWEEDLELLSNLQNDPWHWTKARALRRIRTIVRRKKIKCNKERD